MDINADTNKWGRNLLAFYIDMAGGYSENKAWNEEKI